MNGDNGELGEVTKHVGIVVGDFVRRRDGEDRRCEVPRRTVPIGITRPFVGTDDGAAVGVHLESIRWSLVGAVTAETFDEAATEAERDDKDREANRVQQDADRRSGPQGVLHTDEEVLVRPGVGEPVETHGVHRSDGEQNEGRIPNRGEGSLPRRSEGDVGTAVVASSDGYRRHPAEQSVENAEGVSTSEPLRPVEKAPGDHDERIHREDGRRQQRALLRDIREVLQYPDHDDVARQCWPTAESFGVRPEDG